MMAMLVVYVAFWTATVLFLTYSYNRRCEVLQKLLDRESKSKHGIEDQLSDALDALHEVEPEERARVLAFVGRSLLRPPV